ncbi:MAG TPA: hypothetical protein GX699_08035 [Firmicutes bacterium]|nr:hypothetical protein [Bacillota bacterium]
MAYTSSSANRKNIFRVVAGKEELLLHIEECAVYTIIQRVPLLVPVIGKSHSQRFSQPSPAKHINIECLAVRQVLASCYKKSKNTMQLLLPVQPKAIISCTITPAFLATKVIPRPDKNSAIAILTFSYEIELTYDDFWGKTQTIKQGSGPRRQRVLLDTPAGELDVKLQLTCLLPETYGQHRCMVELKA